MGGTPIPRVIIRARMLSGRTRHELFISSCPMDTVKTSLCTLFEVPWHLASTSKLLQGDEELTSLEGLAYGKLHELTFVLT